MGEGHWLAGVVQVFSGSVGVRDIGCVLKVPVYIQLLWGMGDGVASYRGSGNDM